MRFMNWLAIGLGIILGVIFFTSGLGKVTEPPEQFAELLNVSMPFLSSGITLFLARWTPWIEITLGLFLVVGISAKLMAGVSLFLVAGFIFHNTYIIKNAIEVSECGCFGTFEGSLQIISSAVTARYLDFSMLVLILVILLFYPGKSFTRWPWFLRRG
ncbi:MauE/DoxX family redox-associated membrane protein [Chloroflexota bacterium]